MMKWLSMICVFAFVSQIVLATTHGNPILKGVLKSYDKKTIVLQVEEKRVEVPRTFLRKDLKLISGSIMSIELTEEQFASLKATDI